jgi:hypothetical protein
MRQYLIRILIAFDQLMNTILFGYPNETLSSRAWRRGSIDGNVYWFCFQKFTDWLFLAVGEHHCELSYIYCVTNLKTCGLYFPTYPTNKPPPETIRRITTHLVTPTPKRRNINRTPLAIDHSDFMMGGSEY